MRPGNGKERKNIRKVSDVRVAVETADICMQPFTIWDSWWLFGTVEGDLYSTACGLLLVSV